MRRLAVATLLLLASAARGQDEKPAAAAAEASGARRAWELDAYLGYGQIAWPAPGAEATRWWNGGPALAVAVAYRSPHFTHPFLDLSHVPFLASGRDAYLPGAGASGGRSAYATGSTSAFGFIFGPGFDVSWLRLRAGVGLYLVSVSTTLEGATNSSRSAQLGYLLSASALVWRRGPFAAGVEARLNTLQAPTQGTYQSAWSAGIAGRWDFVAASDQMKAERKE